MSQTEITRGARGAAGTRATGVTPGTATTSASSGAWGGWPFLTGAISELRARRPGMMLLIALAITVAFFASWGATLGILHHELEFWWELALLTVIMLLGHWIEMRSLAQTHIRRELSARPSSGII